MIKYIHSHVAFFTIIILFLTAFGCQNPIPVGGELLEDERIEVLLKEFNDFSSITIVSDSVVTKTGGFTNSTIILGALQDPVFGKNQTRGYIRFRPVSVVDSLLEGNLRPDSLVLILDYGANTYGYKNAVQDIRTFELAQEILTTDTFYSNTVIPVTGQVGFTSMSVNTQDSLEILNHKTGETEKTKAQLRLRLDDNLAQYLIDNKESFSEDTTFSKIFKGLMLESDISGENQSLTYEIALANSRLTLFYTQNDTTKLSQNFSPDIAFNSFVHNRDNAEVARFVNEPSLGDSLLFLQGGGHLKTVIQFSNLDSLENLNINNVSLEITVNNVFSDEEAFPAPRLLNALRKTDDNRLVFLDDLGAGRNFAAIFDGTLKKIGDKNVYKMNITNHIKQSIRDKNYNSDIYLIVETESANLSRGALFGAKNGQNPIRIVITHTQN